MIAKARSGQRPQRSQKVGYTVSAKKLKSVGKTESPKNAPDPATYQTLAYAMLFRSAFGSISLAKTLG